MVRTKFKCVAITKREGWAGNPVVYDAEFQAVGANSDENKKFFAATPAGQIKLSTVREDVFTVSQEYYVDFTPA